jgi:hypothetical protein
VLKAAKIKGSEPAKKLLEIAREAITVGSALG